MNILKLEAGKLLRSPAMWGLFAACLLLNLLLCLPGPAREPLSEPTEPLPNVFDGFDTAGLADIIVNGISDGRAMTGEPARLMREKYAFLQASVDLKARREEALDHYLLGYTNAEHDSLASIWSMLTLEGALFGVLLTMLLVGYDYTHRTELTVYATRTGRKLMRAKLGVSLAMGLAAFVLLWGMTMAMYALFHPYLINVLNDSVSSAFHTLPVIYYHPFITWDSFSVLGYAIAQLGMSLTLVLCFLLIGFVLSVCLRNSYMAFGVFALLAMGLLILPYFLIDVCPMAAYVLNHNPVRLWNAQWLWFTDGVGGYLWPRFETLGTVASLLCMLPLCRLGFKHFNRRELA